MFGMDAMSDAVKGLAEVPEFQNLFLAFTNPILGVLVGALVTGIIQSSTVTKLLKAIGDFERISDHAVNVLESVEELREKGIEFSPAAREEMAVLCAATDEILALTEAAFVGNDIALAYDVEPLEQVIDNLKTLLRNNHIARLKEGSCTVETGFIWSDLITNFERVSDHCSNIAVGIIDVSEHTMNAHEVIKSLKAGNAHYSDKYEEYSSKYSVVKLA